MADFSYIVVDNLGKESKGTMKAASAEQVATLLKAEGKIIVSVNDASAMNKDIEIDFLQKKPTPRDLAVFCRQFVSISSAGVSVTAAFEMLAEQTENKLLANAIFETRKSIQGGMGLAEAMGQFPDVFPSLLITMVAAGEASGNLEISFSRMGDQFEKDAKLRAMVKRASIYPIAILIVAVAAVIVLLSFVVPQFAGMLSDLGEELPAITVMVMAAGNFMESNWPIIVLALVGLALFIRFFSRTPSGKRLFGRLELSMPLFGKLAVKTASARMSRTLATLTAAGIPLIEAIEIVAETMDNVFFKEALLAARDDVSMGTTFSEPLVRSGLFPPLVCHMIKIGEEVGEMESMLVKLADYYDEEVEATTASVMAALEPAIIVVLAVVVGTIIFAVIAPMGAMYEGLNNL